MSEESTNSEESSITTVSRCRGWCITINNFTEDDVLNCMAVEEQSQYWVFGNEVGESGTPHIQGYVYFNNAKTFDQVRMLFDNRAHIEQQSKKSSFSRASNYCKKGEQSKAEWNEEHENGPNFGLNADWYEGGQLPADQATKGKRGLEAIHERWELAKAGRFEDLPPENLAKYEAIYFAYRKVEDRPVLDNKWIFGPSGKGKSRGIREEYAGREDQLYWKDPKTQWWDGYTDQECVIIEDLDPRFEIGWFMKMWTDHYKFRGQIKGGSRMIRPKRVVVTSQYSIDQVFHTDFEETAAIFRRFKDNIYKWNDMFQTFVKHG